jgi:hypothetical protein
MKSDTFTGAHFRVHLVADLRGIGMDHPDFRGGMVHIG